MTTFTNTWGTREVKIGRGVRDAEVMFTVYNTQTDRAEACHLSAADARRLAWKLLRMTEPKRQREGEVS